MVNKCSCRGCLTNYSGGSLSGAVFGLPKEGDVQDAWLKFVNREKEDLKHVYVCEYHFEEKYLNRIEKRSRLITNLKPIPTLLTDSQKNLRKTQLENWVNWNSSRSLYIHRISSDTLSCSGTLPFRHTSSYSFSSTYHLYHFWESLHQEK